MSGHPMSGLFVNVLTAYIAMLISFDEGGITMNVDSGQDYVPPRADNKWKHGKNNKTFWLENGGGQDAVTRAVWQNKG